MPTRLIQTDQQPSGTASFQVVGPVAAQILEPTDLEISIIQPGSVERFLDPRNPADGWTTMIYRFKPVDARRQGNAVLFDVHFPVVYHLRANTPYKLRIRQLEGMEWDEVFTCPPAMRRPSVAPTGYTKDEDVALSVVPATPSPAAAPIDSPVHATVASPASTPIPGEQIEGITLRNEPSVEEIVDPEPPFEPKSARPPAPRPKKWLVPLIAVLVLAAAGGAFLAFMGKDDQKPEVAKEAPAPAPSATLDSIRKFIATSPDAAPAREQADALAKLGKLLDGQFLLYKYAADKGDRESARIVGGFYDPDTWTKESSPMPAANPVEAARWLKQAAEAGDAEAQYRYAMLLKKGRTDEPDGPEQSVAWLKKAADQGHDAAKKASAAP
ncbi:MAG: tetratricopeptide repeat protein [Variovorax sp.]